MSDFKQAYSEHIAAAVRKLMPDEGQVFGPGRTTDLCERCQHDRGEHWDGVGDCGDPYCRCPDFQPAS